MTGDEIRTLLTAIPLFEGLAEAALDELCAGASCIPHAAGEAVVSRGSGGASIYLVVSGRVQVWVQSGEREQMVQELGAGEYFGEIAFVSGQARMATVRAAEPLTVLEFPEGVLQRATRRDPLLAARLVRAGVLRSRASQRLANTAQRPHG